MVVKVETIKEIGGLTVDAPVGLELLASALSEDNHDFKAVAPSELHAVFLKVSGGVLLRGSLTAQLEAPCKRCLKDVRVALPIAFVLNLVPESLLKTGSEDDEEDERKEPDGSFHLDSADQEVFDGKKIDLDPIVREQVLLALPMDAVCKEDCKGLCPVCGQNLNERECSCERKVIDPRLASLKNIKLN